MFKNIKLIKQEIKHSTWGIKEYCMIFHFSCKNENNEKIIVYVNISSTLDFNFYYCSISYEILSELYLTSSPPHHIFNVFNFYRMFGKKLNINNFSQEYDLCYSECYDKFFNKSLKIYYDTINFLERVGL